MITEWVIIITVLPVIRIVTIIWIIIVATVAGITDTSAACNQQTHDENNGSPFFHFFLLRAICRLSSSFLLVPSSSSQLSSLHPLSLSLCRLLLSSYHRTASWHRSKSLFVPLSSL